MADHLLRPFWGDVFVKVGVFQWVSWSKVKFYSPGQMFHCHTILIWLSLHLGLKQTPWIYARRWLRCLSERNTGLTNAMSLLWWWSMMMLCGWVQKCYNLLQMLRTVPYHYISATWILLFLSIVFLLLLCLSYQALPLIPGSFAAVCMTLRPTCATPSVSF